MRRDHLDRLGVLKRRNFLHLSMAVAMTGAQRATGDQRPPDHLRFANAAETLQAAALDGQVDSAVMVVRHGGGERVWAVGRAGSPDAVFLIASISKPMTAAALMTLYDAGALRLDDPVCAYLPEFKADGREQVRVSHLLTHVSGLPDQLPENAQLRSRHAPLADFVAAALRTPLLFAPGAKYSYSSMGILLAAEIAERLSGMPLRQLMADNVFRPLQMQHSALGLGRWSVEQTMLCQLQHAAAESGGGQEQSRHWDWNSRYWRDLGSPWGGVHSSAGDVCKFFTEFLRPSGKLFSEQTTRLMLRNHLGPQMPPRGLGFALGKHASSDACSEQAFGHSGSTGALAWADPQTGTVCVVLTTLPSGSGKLHPRQAASDRVAEVAR